MKLKLSFLILALIIALMWALRKQNEVAPADASTEAEHEVGELKGARHSEAPTVAASTESPLADAWATPEAPSSLFTAPSVPSISANPTADELDNYISALQKVLADNDAIARLNANLTSEEERRYYAALLDKISDASSERTRMRIEVLKNKMRVYRRAVAARKAQLPTVAN